MLKIYNTLTKKKESFIPIDKNNVRYYSCGPTVYNNIHIGNARAFVCADLLAKVLRGIYKKVQDILINDCVVIPAVDVKVSSVRKKNIKGFSSNPAYSTIFVYDLSKD